MTAVARANLSRAAGATHVVSAAVATTPAFQMAGSSNGIPLAWLTWGVDYVVGRAWDAAVSPHIRAAVQEFLGEPATPAYVAPMTPGYVARDLVFSALSHKIGIEVGHAVSSHMGKERQAKRGELVASGSSVGEAALGVHALGGIIGRTFLMSLLFTGLDAAFARLGPPLESTVNKVFGKQGATRSSELREGVPMSTVQQSFEQTARQFGRSFVGGVAYSMLWQSLGAPMAQTVGMSIGGPFGGIVGAICGMLMTDVFTQGVMSVLREPAAQVAQQGARLLKQVIGVPLDAPQAKPDPLPNPGDRIAGTIRGLGVPLTTAFMTNQPGGFALASAQDPWA